MAPPKQILVVDQNDDVRQVVANILLDLGYLVVTLAKDAAGMRVVLAEDGIDRIVLDASTFEAEAITLATFVRERGIRLGMISGQPGLMEAYQDRANQLLWKPFGSDELERVVNHAFVSDTAGQRKEDPA